MSAPEQAGPAWPASSMLEAAWGLIANAYGGNWDAAGDAWRDAARRWRNAYHGGPPGQGHVQEQAEALQQVIDSKPPSEEYPLYQVVPDEHGRKGPHAMVTCDEGWRSSIVACDMYPWAAEWLVRALGRRPFAPGTRP